MESASSKRNKRRNQNRKQSKQQELEKPAPDIAPSSFLTPPKDVPNTQNQESQTQEPSQKSTVAIISNNNSKKRSSTSHLPATTKKPFYKPEHERAMKKKEEIEISQFQAMKLTSKTTSKVTSLSDNCSNKLAEQFASNPSYYLQQWQNYPHLLEEIVKFLSPYSINAWWTLYSSKKFKHMCPYFQLIKNIELYETEFLNKSKGKEKNLKLPSEEISEQQPPKFPPPNKFESGLIDVFKEYETFVLEPQQEWERDVGRLYFCSHPPFRPYASGKTDSKTNSNKESTSNGEVFYSVSDEKQFKRNFDIFTNNQLANWKDWKNMVVIGGSVVASLSHVPQKFTKSPDFFYHHVAYPASDIDIYFYGLTAHQFTEKIKKLYHYLEKQTGGEVLVVRTTFTLTFITKFPSRHIQIVLGKWNCLDEILFEPDIDCTCVAYDGSRVWATQRARLSYNKKWIVASEKRYAVRAFPEYESRLIKYSRRGFYIVDEKLQWKNVSNEWLDIAKQRLLEHKVVQGRAGVTGLRLLIAGIKFPEVLEKVDIFQLESFKETGLAYGPKWNQRNIRKRLAEPIYEKSHYGPYEVENPYKIVDDVDKLELSLQDLDDNSKSASWRYHPRWYNHLWRDDYKRETRASERQWD